jgi:translocation protein SEC63
VAIKDSAPFDPYNILELEKGATDKEVKRAYRQLSLKFHPDKNPDPEANKYFAEYITKAYQALSDPVARDNYEKYGHPDGQQVLHCCYTVPIPQELCCTCACRSKRTSVCM